MDIIVTKAEGVSTHVLDALRDLRDVVALTFGATNPVRIRFVDFGPAPQTTCGIHVEVLVDFTEARYKDFESNRQRINTVVQQIVGEAYAVRIGCFLIYGEVEEFHPSPPPL